MPGGVHEHMRAWEPEEDQLIIRLLNELGPKWSKIVEQLPGRSVSSVRNRWQRIDKGNKLREAGKESKNRCQQCGKPKRGHVCPYQPRVVKDPTAPAVPTRNAAVQVEMDERLAVRHLSLAAQGYPESYGEIPPPPPPGAPPNYSPGGSGASPDLSFSGDLSLGSAGALPLSPG